MSLDALPPSLRGNPRLSTWLRFRSDGVVEARSGKVELGQGILTALAQVVAEELDVSPARVRMLHARTGESPNEGVTSGSLSVQDSGKALRWACAEARALFLEAAAARLGVGADTLHVRDGAIVTAHGGATSYWDLAGEVSLERDATASVPPKSGAQLMTIGKNAPRLDLPDKVFGRARFVHDFEREHMLHGRVLRPPSPGAKLVSLDEASVRALPHVTAVVRDGNFVGVLAEREEAAVGALSTLRKAARWDPAGQLPDMSKLDEWILAQPIDTTVIDEVQGPAPAVARTYRGRFTRPFTAHASMAPSCAVAQWNGAGLHVWTHAQGLYNLRADLALALRMEPERIVVEHREGAGCYGHNGADDVVLDAALLARAAGERPVKVLWSRADELAWSPFGPAMLVDVAADVDASGAIVAWRGDVWSNGHGTRPGRGKTPVLLAASHLSNGFEPPVAVNAPFASGGGSERNSIPPYAIGWRRIRNHRVLSMPIRTSALRSLGAAANVFAIEAMVDDIARDRGEDPLAWRLRNLADPRARAVLQAAARRIGWSSRRAKEGTGFGIAFARYKHTAAYCAVAAEIEAGRDIRVRRLCIGVDVGLAINPDGVVNQIEGGAIQATSWALKEAVHFDRTRITSDAWAEYPILKFSEVPGVEVDVLQRVDEPSMGAGEASIGPTVAAIANAVCDALGLRVSSLPMTAERIAASAHAGTG